MARARGRANSTRPPSDRYRLRRGCARSPYSSRGMMTDYSLVIEGSTYGGSVAVVRDRNVIAERTLVDSGTPSRAGREERVLPSVAECLDEAGISARGLARVICGAGPGSFTSLRVSASVAKGTAVGVG